MAGELNALRKTAREYADLVEEREAAFVADMVRVAAATTDAARTRATARLTTAATRLSEVRVQDALVDAIALVDPATAIASLETNPIALLPVRIETRFRRRQRAWSLQVRIYPDQIHTDGHEPRLTDAETTDGVRYWAASGAEEPAAWSELARVHGPERAAWIRRSTSPGITSPDTTTTPYTRAARTNVLPDRFGCVAYRDGAEVARASGLPVRDPLAVGPDPTATIGADGLDDGNRWLADFALATQQGMAVTLDLGAGGQAGVDLLVVYGVKAAVTPADGARRLAQVLDAHHYHDGLGFLAPGTVTNNSGPDGAARSGWSTRDTADGAASHRAEIAASGVVPVDASAAAIARAEATDGRRLAAAFGIPTEHLAQIEGAGDTTELDARAMLLALWPGVAGYGIRQFLASTVPERLADALRSHAVGFVRPRGPLPTLRVGRQPYGVLPVTSLARYTPPSSDDGSLAAIRDGLEKLVAVWRDAADTAPRMGTGNPERDISEILALSPVSIGYRLRREVDKQLIGVLGSLAQVDERETAMLDTFHRNLLAATLKAIGGLSPGDGLQGLLAFDDAPRLTRALVQEQPLSTSAPLVDNYIQFLRTASPGDILNAPGRAGGPLLYLLLRASVLAQYLDDGAKLAEIPKSSQELLDRFTVVDLPGEGPDGLLRELLPKPPSGPPGDGGTVYPIGEVLRMIVDRVGDEPLVRFEQPFGERTTVLTREGDLTWPPPGTTPPLGTPGAIGLPTGPLGPAAPGLAAGPGSPATPGVSPMPGAPPGPGPPAGPGVLRLAGPAAPRRRLPVDTGPATIRLEETRATSIAVGRRVFDSLPDRAKALDFGMVDLAAALAHLQKLPSARLDRLMRETLDLGAQRLDAWVTSLATRRLGELRAAAPTGVHIGAYGFVHDLRPAARNDQAGGGFVHAPSVSHAVTAAVLRSGHMARGGGDTELAIDLSSARVRTACEVLDAVRNGIRTGAVLGSLFERELGRQGRAAIGPARQAAPLAGSLGAGAVPAASDGEALLQAFKDGSVTAAGLAAASGVPANEQDKVEKAAAAALNALADAADAVADLLLAESVHQLTGRNLPRALAAMSATSGGRPPDEFDVDRVAPQGVGMSQKLSVLHRGPVPTPATVTARSLLDPFLDAWVSATLGAFSTATLTAALDDGTNLTVSLDDTGLAPLDAVAMSSPASTGAVPPLVRVLSDLAVAAAGDRKVTAVDTSALEQFQGTARAVARVLGGARAFDASDVTGDIEVNVGSVRDRVGSAVTYVEGILVDAEVLAAVAAPSSAELRAGLKILQSGGLLQAVPVVPPGVQREAELLAEQQRHGAAELRRRYDAALNALPSATATDPQALAALRTAASALVNEQVPLTVPLRAKALDDAFDRRPAVGGGTDEERRQAARALLRDTAPVRPAASNLQRLRQVIQGGSGTVPAVDLLQFVADQLADEPWAGAADPARAGTDQPAVAAGRTSVLLLETGLPPGANAATVGLVLDEWSETVPAPVLTTALAVHANRPSNEAPQAVLLAVPPDPDAGWDQATLEAVVLETFDLARIRAVDLPALPTLGQLVPMLHVPIAGLSFNKDLRWSDLVRHLA